ncbi:MAG: UDP-N-acetylglucosamine 2-epimerase (non-hydrolyzing) [Patescibacteria group bacterium]|jgi:UDP-N-acetylglucosamine 2-epimerase (non-hydrolysing)
MDLKKSNLKVMTIFGTRPEIIRMSRVFAKLDQFVNHIMVHTGQSFDYEMDKVFFEELGIRKPDYFLEIKSETLGGQIANVILKSEEVFKKEMPDALVLLGDTNSALSTIIAKRMKIPIFHLEAGNRSFDENVPEEINRRIVDHISDLNFPYSENARLNLLREGIHPGKMFTTGSPLPEVLEYHKQSITKSTILDDLKLEPKAYFLVSIHREENVDSEKQLSILIEILNTVAEKYNFPLIVTTHPRTKKRLDEHKFTPHKLINFHKPFGFFEYVHLQMNAFCVLSDSGTIQEECSNLGFPAIQVRNSSERPEAFDEGVTILTGLDKDIVLKSIEIITQQKIEGLKFNIPQAYKDTNFSSKVLRHIVGLAKITKKRRGDPMV